ncbi:MAG: hypothetical protein Q9187_009543 [Circinaria calcarea]
MQRAAFSSASPSPSSAPLTPSTPTHAPISPFQSHSHSHSHASSHKRQKLSEPSMPSTPNPDALAIQAALAAEEAKRTEALERQAVQGDETKWVLSLSASEGGKVLEGGGGGGEIRTVTMGYEDIDTGMSTGAWRQGGEEGGEEPWRPVMIGRRSFGKFNRALERSSPNNPGSAEGESEDDEDDPTGTNALLRASKAEAGQRAKEELKTQRKAAKAEAARLAEKRTSKEVKLKKLRSISGGGIEAGKIIRKNRMEERKNKAKKAREELEY